MNTQKTLRRSALLATLLILSSAIAVGIYSRASKSQKKQKQGIQAYDAPKVTEIPEVVSRIEGLEIAGVTLINQGTQAAALDIDVINHRDEAVMALDFVSWAKTDSSGQRYDGSWDEIIRA